LTSKTVIKGNLRAKEPRGAARKPWGGGTRPSGEGEVREGQLEGACWKKTIGRGTAASRTAPEAMGKGAPRDKKRVVKGRWEGETSQGKEVPEKGGEPAKNPQNWA